ncbi:MAG: hypothetical protein LAT76_04640 [Schleiferiaceae bacterium]|nr:hypothetical protein [Schleiferiaceae bacterium]
MKPYNKYIAGLAALFLSFSTQAQSQPEMADLMRKEGKIYVVVAVILIIFIVLAAFLIYLDRKISRVEKESQS